LADVPEDVIRTIIDPLILSAKIAQRIEGNTDDERLAEAARRGLVVPVRFLLDRGADVHFQRDRALRDAARNGHIDVVTLLLDRGADVHADRESALRRAAGNHKLDVVRLLVRRGASVVAYNFSPITSAARSGDYEIVSFLQLHGGSDQQARVMCLIMACERNYVQIARLMLDCGAPIRKQPGLYDPLKTAALFESEDVLRLLLDRGADVHESSDYALRMASSSGHLDIVRMLLERGADPSALNSDALLLAVDAINSRHARRENIEIVRMLLERGANVHVFNDEALVKAAGSREPLAVPMTETLLAHGATINAVHFNRTALCEAVSRGSFDVVRLLVDRGADVNFNSGSDFSPLALARYFGHRKIVDYLVSHGARDSTAAGAAPPAGS